MGCCVHCLFVGWYCCCCWVIDEEGKDEKGERACRHCRKDGCGTQPPRETVHFMLFSQRVVSMIGVALQWGAVARLSCLAGLSRILLMSQYWPQPINFYVKRTEVDCVANIGSWLERVQVAYLGSTCLSIRQIRIQLGRFASLKVLIPTEFGSWTPLKILSKSSSQNLLKIKLSKSSQNQVLKIKLSQSSQNPLKILSSSTSKKLN